MRRGITILTLALALALACASSPASAAGGPATICESSLIIFTDPSNPGTVTQAGQITHVRDSGVLGWYYSGTLEGYMLAGAQDIRINAVTNQAQLRGSFVAVGPEGSTVTISYAGHADLTTGRATGSFVAMDGTGMLDDFNWSGQIEAQLIGPASFDATDTGRCTGAPAA